jgi:hypothetical protein
MPVPFCELLLGDAQFLDSGLDLLRRQKPNVLSQLAQPAGVGIGVCDVGPVADQAEVPPSLHECGTGQADFGLASRRNRSGLGEPVGNVVRHRHTRLGRLGSDRAFQFVGQVDDDAHRDGFGLGMTVERCIVRPQV